MYQLYLVLDYPLSLALDIVKVIPKLLYSRKLEEIGYGDDIVLAE